MYKKLKRLTWVSLVGLAVCATSFACREVRKEIEVSSEVEGTDSQTAPLDTDSATPLTCEGVTCVSSPANDCSDDTTLAVYNPIGWCDAGKCFYPQREETCDPGNCETGVCSQRPCQGVSCAQPPESTCADASGSLVVSNSIGYCAPEDGAPACTYPKKEVSCGGACQDGRCVDNPCAGLVCNVAPARYCDGQELVVFDILGRCDEGHCEHLEQRVTCDNDCIDGRCSGQDPCEHVSCLTPPAQYCWNPSTLRTFKKSGSCDTGNCIYEHQDNPCPDSGLCSNGRCENAPCLGVECLDPPAPYCSDENTLTSWDNESNVCNETTGACDYGTEEHVCAGGCAGAACIDDPCVGKVCDSPPANYCDGDKQVEYSAPGQCLNSGWCSYSSTLVECPICMEGKCIDYCELDTSADCGIVFPTGYTSDQCYDEAVGPASCDSYGGSTLLHSVGCNTTNYVAFCGQDGQYADPDVFYTPPRYSNSGSDTDSEEVVTDKLTGLQWQYTIPSTTYIWQEAIDYCDGLSYGGQTDWRLPDAHELRGLITYGKYAPATDFPGVTSLNDEYFWSSSPSVRKENDAWYVTFARGRVYDGDMSIGYFVRCVRGGMSLTTTTQERFVQPDASKPLILDRKTGLYWEEDQSSTKMTWEAALAYCESQETGGYTNWRLPNIQELASLVNYGNSTVASDFPGITGQNLWSSSQIIGHTDLAWKVIFAMGNVHYSSKGIDLFVRCVREGP